MRGTLSCLQTTLTVTPAIARLTVLKDSHDIQFNASSTISVSNVKIDAADHSQPASELLVDHAKQKVTAKLSTALKAGSQVKLHVDWQGKLRDDMTGTLRSSATGKLELIHLSVEVTTIHLRRTKTRNCEVLFSAKSL